MKLSVFKTLPSLALVLLVALALRLVWAWLVPVVPVSDSVGYDTFARTLLEHGVFGWTRDEPFAFWPPGTTFLHAAVYGLFGYHYAAIVGMNIILSLILIVSTARLALRLHGERAAIVAAWVLALWPTLVVFTTVLASELPFLVFSVVALDVWTASSRPSLARGLLVGVLLGVAALVRPLALALPVVYAFAMVVQTWAARDLAVRHAVTGVVAALAMGLVIAPWTWRNHQLYGETVLVSTNGGITLWMGNAPGTDGRYLPVPDELSHLSDHEQAQILGARARQYILDDPVGFVVRSVRKLGILYGNESIGALWNSEGIATVWGDAAVVVTKRLTQVTWLLILLVALAGFVALWRQSGVVAALFSPLTVSIAFYSVVHSIMVAQERYHLSFAAQIAIFFGVAVAAWRARAASKDASDAGAGQAPVRTRAG